MSRIILSAQNFDIYEGDGRDSLARTGSISAEMLAAAGAQGVILGHPETRDSVEEVHSKLMTLVQCQVTTPGSLPYLTLMVGEDWDEFIGHPADEVARTNVTKLLQILAAVPKTVLEKMVVGYDPKWGSRGNGHDDDEPPAPAYISATALALKEGLKEAFGEDAKSVPVIYGGRSTPERTEEILADINIDGLILGSACNTVQKALDIARAMGKAMGSRRKLLHANFKAYNLPDSYEQYVAAFKKLDDSFTIYLSPNYTDIRAVQAALAY